MAVRENALKEWLFTLLNHQAFTLKRLPGDASFRSYYRLEVDGLSRIIMDAPPEQEDTQAFVKIAKTLRQQEVFTPEILVENKKDGFLLLSDFGDTLLLDKLQQETADDYYKEAIQTLFKIQTCSIEESIGSFNQAFMLKEMDLCTQWFFKAYLSLSLLEEEQALIKNTFHWLAATIALQPQVFIHRDYHSRNLMILSHPSLGVLDFQDAMCGPLTYDLVSLLKDCYIAWPRHKVLDWVAYFYNNSELTLPYTLEEFIRAFDLCGLQRHLKVLGIFSRLSLRDNKPRYLKHLPLTLNYVLECSRLYEPLHAFYDFLQQRVYLT